MHTVSQEGLQLAGRGDGETSPDTCTPAEQWEQRQGSSWESRVL